MNRLAITPICKNGKEYIGEILLDENRDFLDFQLYETEENSYMNRIYVARVEDIVPSIKAAFVRITKDMKCYLPLEDCKNPIYTNKRSKSTALASGDELLVQVVRDKIKSKDPVVTTKLTLQGRGAILTTDNLSLGISKKITGDKRAQLSEWLSERVSSQWPESSDENKNRDFGILLRTVAAQLSIDELQEDIISLIYQFQKIKETAKHLAPFSLMYQESPSYVLRLKSLDMSQIDTILTDSPSIHEKIKDLIPGIAEKCSLYEDKAISLNRLYKIDTTIDELLQKRVWLKSGANIIIEQLETLTFIDVNSAKNQSKKTDTMLAVNLEAAKEVARQLRLRNISGMIIVDFINMSSDEEQQQIIKCLRDEFANDYCPCHFVDITKLGLVEITRKKVFRSLKEILQIGVDTE